MKLDHVTLRHGAAPATHSVGVRKPLVDGIEKVTGRARYTADLPLGRALVGRILRRPIAHGMHPLASTPPRRARFPACVRSSPARTSPRPTA